MTSFFMNYIRSMARSVLRTSMIQGNLFDTKPDRNPVTGFPRSDMVVEAEEAQAETEKDQPGS